MEQGLRGKGWLELRKERQLWQCNKGTSCLLCHDLRAYMSAVKKAVGHISECPPIRLECMKT